MLYDKYLKRIKKLANFLKTVKKHRVLILIVISIAFASVAAFLATQGAVIDNKGCPTEIVYGEKLSYSANALFRDVSYEYASASSPDSWSSTEPYAPGKYLVRAVSTSSFGKPRYGNSHEYTIKQRPVTVCVNESQILYGNSPTVSADLVYNDTVFCDTYIYEDISLKNTNINAASNSIIIKDKNGKDVTNYYIISTASSPITILPLNITVTISDHEEAYNGTEIKYNGFEIAEGKLVDGNTLYATIDSSIVEVGKTENTASSWLVVDKDNKNVTAHYVINEIKGTLTVNKRPIFIETYGGSFVYDGTQHSVTEYKVLESDGFYSLVNGHSLELLSGYPTITNVSSVENILRFNVLDENGKDISSNYSIYLSAPQTLEITHRPITLTTGNLTVTYDDEIHYNDEYLISGDGFASGHHPAYSDKIEVIDAGVTENCVTMLILDQNSKDVTENYKITYNYGTFTVNPIVLYVTTEGDEKTYDGTPLVVNKYVISNLEDILPGHEITGESFTELLDVFVDNEGNISGVSNKVDLTIKADDSLVSSSPVSLGLFTKLDSTSSERDVSKNYSLNYGENDQNAGVLKVHPREITVETLSQSFVYDGNPHQFLSFNIIDGTVVDGEIMSAVSGDASASITHVSDGVVENLLEYSFSDQEGNEIPRQNYRVYCPQDKIGALRMVALSLKIRTMSQSFVYDGQEHAYCEENAGYEIIIGELPEGHSLEILNASVVLNYGSPVENSIEFILKAGDIEAEADDYNIEYENTGVLSILQRPVTIVANSDTKIYDGAPLSNNGYSILDDENDPFDSLVESHYIDSILIVGEITNVGEVSNAASDALIKCGEVDVTANYSISYVSSSLTITPRPILVSTAGDEWVYDGVAHSNNNFEIIVDNEQYLSLVEGHSLILEYSFEIINVWESGENTLSVIVDNDEITQNYSITYQYGTVNITPRTITVESFDGSWMYDGEIHTSQEYEDLNGGYSIGGDGLGDYLYSKLSTFSNIQNVYEGNIQNNITIILYHLSTDEMIDERNYVIESYTYGNLTITKRPVLVSTSSDSWIYDGVAHSSDGFALIAGREGYFDLVGNHYLTLNSSYPITNTWESGENTLTVIVSDDLTTLNYDIQYECGTVTINKRVLTVESFNGTWMYDGEIHTSQELGIINGGYSVGGNGHGEYLYSMLSSSSSILNVYDGEIENNITIKLYLLSNDELVDERNYEIKSYTYGTLTITQRPILVSTSSDSWIYDGAPHSNEGFALVEGVLGYESLCEGDALILAHGFSITNVWENCENMIAVYVNDEFMTQNYAITYQYGTLTILPRDVTVESFNGSWMYDGNEHTSQEFGITNGGYTVGGEELGEYLYSELVDISRITNVYDGNVENYITVILRLKETGEVVDTRNYNIVQYTYGTLAITPRPILVGTATDSWTYDGIEHYNQDFWLIENADGYETLVNNHSLVLSPYSVITKVLNVWDTFEGNNVLSVIVENELITQNYDIHYEYGTLTINKRQLTVNTFDGSWMYDGEEHTSQELEVSNGGYTVGGDGHGDYLYSALSSYSSVTNVYEGKITNEITIKLYIIATDEEVDQRNYEVTYESFGQLEITPRPILVGTATDEWIYDGTDHWNSGFELIENAEGYYSLVNNHSLKLVEYTVIRNTWESYENVITVIVEDELATQNYTISYENGTLTINKREITVESYNGSWIYDSQEHTSQEYGVTNGGYTIGGEGLGEYLYSKLSSHSSVTNVSDGRVANEISIKLYLIENDEVVDLRNYEITLEEFGYLEITKRQITVTTHDGSWIYDGISHSNTGEDVLNGGYSIGGDGLCDNLFFITESASSITNFWESGTENEIVLVLYLESTNAPVDQSNYAITYAFGTLSITPRDITVESFNGSWMYDGNEHTSQEFGITNGGYTVGGEELGEYLYSELVDISRITNVYDGNVENYITVILRLKETGEVVDTRNYNIVQYTYGTLAITPRPILVGTATDSWTYDGIEHYNQDFWLIENADGYETLVNNHSLVLSPYSVITKVLNVWDTFEGNNVLSVIVENELITQNYDIHYEYGTLTINKRQLTVNTFDGSWMYDGEEHTSQELEVSNGGYTVGGDGHGDYLYSALSSYSSVTNVYEGKITNEITIKLYIIATDEEVDQRNYEVTYESFGQLEITPRPILVGTATDEWIYDGTDHWNSGFELIENAEGYYSLVNNHSLKLVEYTVIRNTWESYENVITVIVEDELATQNYTISYENGTLTINKREITVESYNGSWIYDSQEHTSQEYGVTNGGYTIGGEGLGEYLYSKLSSHSSVTNVSDGRVANEISIKLYLIENDEVVDLRNYEITLEEFGYLEITPRQIIVESFNGSWVYDSLEHTSQEYGIENGGYTVLGDGLSDFFYTKLTSYSFIKNVYDGKVTNAITVKLYYIENNEEVDPSNYKIDYNSFGYLQITPRQIIVESFNGSWMYDGEEHTSQEYGVENGGYTIGGDGLGEHLYAKLSSYSSVTNVYEGKVINEITIRLYIKETHDRIDYRNYNVIYDQFGHLEITPRPILISTSTDEWTYDGEEHWNNNFKVVEDVTGYESLVEGHTIKLLSYPKITNTWESCENIFTLIVEDDLTTLNYEISYDYGKITINPRPILVQTGTASKTYDGEPLSSEKLVLLVGNGYMDLVKNHTLKISKHYSIVNVSESGDNLIEVIVNDYETTKNYDISYEYGTLTIQPRELLVSTGSGTWEYDGKPHSNPSYEIISGSLANNQTLKITKSFEITHTWESGDNKIVLGVFANNTEVTDNYIIEYEYGTLTITPKPLKITAASDTKIYDGKPLTNTEYTCEGLVGGDKIQSIKVVGSQTEIGSCDNVASDAKIENSNKLDVTGDYKIEYVNGTLTVTKAVISIQLDSDSWEYDGEAHSAPTATVTYGKLASGDYIIPTDLSKVPTITEIGKKENRFEIKIVNSNGKDVTSSYEIQEILSGVIEITGEKDDDDDNGGGGGGGGGGSTELDISGGLGGSGSGGDGNGEPVLVMRIRSTQSGSIYMRLMSFGNYNGSGWDPANAYPYLLGNKFSYDYLTGISLELLGYEKVLLEVDSKSSQYMLPYYLAMLDGDYIIPVDDTTFDTSHDGTYTLTYYQYTGYGNGLKQDLGAYSDIEDAYREFVELNYLQIDSETQKYMDGIIAEQGFDVSNPNIVEDVAEYIRGAATYNLDYNPALDKESNVVVEFLKTYKEGVCRHYASAAVLLYRALGIPARYTIGYVGSTEADQWTEIKSDSGHAWAEVYINGVGWVMVEVTGGGFGGGGGGGNDDDITPPKPEITICPVSRDKTYDGTPLYALNELNETDLDIRELLSNGYTYEVIVQGSQTEIGSSPAKIVSFKLYDPSGIDVTDEYIIHYEDGLLRVMEGIKITVTVYSLEREYNGELYQFGEKHFYNMQGISLEDYDVDLRISGGITDAGILKMEDIKYTLVVIRKSDGANVSKDYYVSFEGDPLTVTKRKITLIADSETREFNGEPLQNSGFTLSQGSYLIEGHTVDAKAVGSIIDPGIAKNEIVENTPRVYDAEGRDVTANYEFELIPGYLIVTEEN